MRLDGAREITGVRQAEPSSQASRRVVANRLNARGDGILDGRPSRAIRAVLLERFASLVAPIERAQRLGETVVGLAKRREERDRTLEVRDRLGVAALARRNATEPKLGDWRRGLLLRQP